MSDKEPKYYVNPQTLAILRDDIHTIPAGAVHVSKELRAVLLSGQAEGKQIVNDNGVIMLREKGAPTPAEVAQMRQAAYRLEADPLKLEAEYDALSAGLEPDYTLWMAKVAEIKARYPFA